ncbi:hypothetical protein BH24PSE2_BH24PSE2_20620 [soil metagenome]
MALNAQDGTIIWPEDDAVMGVLGYREAQNTAVEIILPDRQTIATVSLPMLAILKLLAWSERHLRSPRKDASDLFLILSSYLNDDEHATQLYTSAAHLLDRDDFNYQVAAAWLAGHNAARCIMEHSDQPRRLLEALEHILKAETNAEGDLHLVSEVGNNAPEALRWIGGFSRA